jgi:diguanylate cyclase (GGDEF)-like protein/PAS domain S-box-containing protein
MNWFGLPTTSVVLSQTHDGVLVLDGQNRIRAANDRFWAWTSYPRGLVLGQDVAVLWDDAHRWSDWLTALRLGAGSKGTETLDLKDKDGDLIPVEAQLTFLKGTWGRAPAVVLVLHDLRPLRLAEKLVRSDALTGVASRASLVPFLEEQLVRAQLHGSSLGLVLLDIDGFKALNQRWGPGFGDEVLRVVGAELRDAVGPGDLAGRFGSEEFLAILPQSTLVKAAAFAEGLRANLEERLFAPQGTRVRITASFGVTVAHPQGHDTLATVLGRVDEALDGAKDRGRNRVEVSP